MKKAKGRHDFCLRCLTMMIAKHRLQIPQRRHPVLGDDSTGYKSFEAAKAKLKTKRVPSCRCFDCCQIVLSVPQKSVISEHIGRKVFWVGFVA